MDIDALARKVIANRAAAGLIAADGVACANHAQKAYRDFRHELKKRADWGNLPADLHDRLIALKRAV